MVNMKTGTEKILEETIVRYSALKGEKENLLTAFETIKKSFEEGGKLYLCGNGGSASDCEHIAGELLKSFKIPRPLEGDCAALFDPYGEDGKALAERLEGGLPAISLCGHPAFSTAFVNDKDPYFGFAQQINVWCTPNDVLLAISTSGNSKNCVYAVIAAKAKNMKVVFLGGGNGGRMKDIADVSIVVPERETYKVQELHLPVYHCICAMLEHEFFYREKY